MSSTRRSQLINHNLIECLGQLLLSQGNPPERVDKPACDHATGVKGPLQAASRQSRTAVSKARKAGPGPVGGVVRVE